MSTRPAPPPLRPAQGLGGAGAAAKILEEMVKLHSSVYGWDKTVKITAYACGLLSNSLARVRGPEDDWTVGLQQAGSYFGLWRVGGRLAGGPFGLPAELDNLIASRWHGGWSDPIIQTCNVLQSLSMLVYYPLEHALFFSAAVPRLCKLDPKKADVYSRIACAAWTFWLLVDLYAVRRRFQELGRIGEALRKNGQLDAKSEEILRRKKGDLYWHMTRLLLYLPNAVHWTLPADSPYALEQWMVNLFGLAEGIVGMISFVNGRSPSAPQLPKP